jgi:acetyl-CoA decarbonylase/synthase complex subunit gamma
MDRQYITGWADTPAGRVPRVPGELTRADKWGGIKALWSIGRMNYTVDPALYAVGNPDQDSPVFVSANYKLSFDTLRRELSGLDAWTMVLDTKGINVWCAAGKGTFGTQEIVNRIKHTRLDEIVNHRKLIVPQLGAPGVASHEVKKLSGFSVIYGPVRAPDIKPFLDAGMVATGEMRRVTFPVLDRLRLVPVDVLGGLKYLVLAAAMLFLLAGLSRDGYSGDLALANGTRAILNIVLAYLAGTLLGPALLPWLPGRSFSLKGFSAGLAMFAVSYVTGLAGGNPIEIIAWLLIMPVIASFITMNFTGASTYTSLSGVRKEMRLAVPLQITCIVIGTVLWIVSRFA